jgi:eukaryotic-like serine/threonine-protein kinase
MEPANWELVKKLFDATLALPPQERTQFLKENCSIQAIRMEVLSLLENFESAGSFLELEREMPAVKVSGADEWGIARYRLVQRIGEGGMGEVWLAEQTMPVHRQVALKLIKAGLNTREAIARFDSERQALALMDHPAIAKVFDAGATPQGAPYFVMEYVSGIPITEYCDEHRLSPDERLELLTQVCDGVQHAHQKAIIHRDLKPSNILIADVDGKPVPKIIDFGLAKALTEKLTDETLCTRTGALVGTPEYMSPEQASTGGQDIDTRTDVYSLGIILYELLAGAPPIELRKATLEEFLRRLREEDPEKPSMKMSRYDVTASTDVANKRRTDPQALTRELRGELDSITLKALEKDRSRRYASASDLAADIKRYLRNEAVLAVAPSLAYRARKSARRHRVALATASTVALVLVVAAVVSFRESRRANREAAEAEAVNDFLQRDLLAQAGASAQSGPATKPDPDLKVRTALDRAAARVESKFTKQPEVEASIRGTVGQAYIDLGLYSEAREQLERATELHRRVLGAEDAKTLKSIGQLGRLAYLQGRYPEAEMLEKQVFEAQLRVLGAEHPDTLTSINSLAGVYLDEGKYSQAEALETQNLEIRRRVSGPEHPDTLTVGMNLASVYQLEGKYAQAEALNVQTLEIQKRVLGSEHPHTLMSMNNLALLYDEEGKYAQAEPLLMQTLEIKKRVLGPEHPETLLSMNNLADVYGHEGKFVEAKAILAETLEIQKRVLGPGHPDTAITMYSLGGLAARRGDRDEAIAYLSESVDHGLTPAGDLNMEADTDLASLHDDPRFAALIAHAKQIGEAKQKDAATQKAK